jgi:hypothetical protein
MPATPQVAGPCAVYVALPSVSAGVPLLLGYTRNGAQIREETFHLNIPGDQNGGDEGPPIDVQQLGMVVHIVLELTKWDKTVADHIRKQADGATLGTPVAPGSLMFTANLGWRLTLVPSLGSGIGQPLNFPRCITRQPREINIGTKFSTMFVEFEAHKASEGVLWNNSTTGIM